jgi:ribonucleoside-diphosphate reductase alpha chain
MNRKIGLGVMGFADMLILLGVPYQSDRAVVLAGDRSCPASSKTAESASAELAAIEGKFPGIPPECISFKRGETQRRNATLTTVAPTGTISILAGVSSGVEPVFAFEVAAPHRRSACIRTRIRSTSDTGAKAATIDKKHFSDRLGCLALAGHLKVQAAFQKYTENAVSKTVNLPETTAAEEIFDLFLQAADMNLKGITVYRE